MKNSASKNLAKQVAAVYKTEKQFIQNLLKFLPKFNNLSSSTEPKPEKVEAVVKTSDDPNRVRSLKKLRNIKKKQLKRSEKQSKKRVSNAKVVDKHDRTPLKKPSVKKDNGEIVYSKFDFISDDKKPKEFTINPKPVIAEKALQRVEKKASVIKKLKEEGELSKAVEIAAKHKWNNALQRAKGTKVKDDPALLRKSINKQDKMKKDKQKKWQQRVDFQEKQMDKKQQKRQANIQSKKDEKVKRQKKILRKRGRIA